MWLIDLQNCNVATRNYANDPQINEKNNFKFIRHAQNFR